MLNDWRPAFVLFYGGALAMAALFGAIVINGGSPVTPEIYGPWVYAVPALFWVGVQVGGAVTAMAGALFGLRWLAALGGTAITFMLIFFGVMALGAGADGTILVTGTLGWLAPVSAVLVYLSIWGEQDGNEQRE